MSAPAPMARRGGVNWAISAASIRATAAAPEGASHQAQKECRNHHHPLQHHAGKHAPQHHAGRGNPAAEHQPAATAPPTSIAPPPSSAPRPLPSRGRDRPAPSPAPQSLGQDCAPRQPPACGDGIRHARLWEVASRAEKRPAKPRKYSRGIFPRQPRKALTCRPKGRVRATTGRDSCSPGNRRRLFTEPLRNRPGHTDKACIPPRRSLQACEALVPRPGLRLVWPLRVVRSARRVFQRPVGGVFGMDARRVEQRHRRIGRADQQADFSAAQDDALRTLRRPVRRSPGGRTRATPRGSRRGTVRRK